jgi:hypothetical protein
MTKYQALLDRWHKGGNHGELLTLLENPVLKEALAVVESMSVPDAVQMAKITTSNLDADRVAQALAHTACLQAGVSKSVALLKALTRKRKESDTPAELEPYSHITEEYLYGKH